MADIALYKTYIDDILMVASKVTLDAVLGVLNSFDEGITVTHDDSAHDKATSFFDLAIHINRGYVHYSTIVGPCVCTSTSLIIHARTAVAS